MHFIEFNANTKMACRAVVVSLLCILLTHEFTFERAYWTYLTAFMLITQSFGDGIYRSLIRFIMTIIGCLMGWVIYLPVESHPTALMLIILISLFLMIYWFNTSIIGRNLATGILLVSSFGLMSGGWTFDMLWTRIEDTFIGAAIAIVVNGLILPEFSKTNMQNTFLTLRSKLALLYHRLTLQKLNLKELHTLQEEIQSLEKDRLALAQNYQLSRYEILFNQRKRKLYKNMLTQTNIVFSYIHAFSDIKIAELSRNGGIKQKLAESGRSYYQERLTTELQKLAMI